MWPPGSGGGVTFGGVLMWPQVQSLGVCMSPTLCLSHDGVYLETLSLLFYCKRVLFPWDFQQLSCGEGKEAYVAGSEQGSQGRWSLKSHARKAFMGSLKTRLEGGYGVGYLLRDLLLIGWWWGHQELASSPSGYNGSGVCVLVGSMQLTFPPVGDLSVYKTAHRTRLRHYPQPLRRSLGPWLCLMAMLLFSPLWQFSFLSACLTSLVKCTHFGAQISRGSLRFSTDRRQVEDMVCFSLKFDDFGLMD